MTDERTDNGIPVTPGLMVWTNNLDRGRVGEVAHTDPNGDWYWVYFTDKPGRDMMNGTRMTTRHPFTGELA